MKKAWKNPVLTVHGDVAEMTGGCIVIKQPGSGDDLGTNVDTVEVIDDVCPS